MKPKLLLCLALVLSGGYISSRANETNAIASTDLSSEYEAALKQNAENAARALFQTRLRNTDQLANIDGETFLREYYTISKENQSELENLTKRAKLSPDRARKLKALFFEATNLNGKDVDNNLGKQISDVPAESKKIATETSRAELRRDEGPKQYFGRYLANCDTNAITVCPRFIGYSPEKRINV